MFIIDLVGSLIIRRGIPKISNYNFLGSILNFFIVGLTEEIVFRGSIFNLSLKIFGYKKSNIIQSVSFMLAHFLPWCFVLIMGANFSSVPWSYLSMQLPFCLIFGYITGWTFNKTKSILTTITMHSLGDVIGYFFIGGI